MSKTYKETVEYAKEHGILLDSCGLDERMKDSGLYTDLCGFPYETAIEQMKGGSGGGASTGETRESNTLHIETYAAESGKYGIRIRADKAVDGNLKITLTVNGIQHEAALASGDSEAAVDGVELSTDSASVENAIVTPQETAKYRFTITNDVKPLALKFRLGTIKENGLSAITEATIDGLSEYESGTEVDVMVPADSTGGYAAALEAANNGDETLWDEWAANNQYAIVIAYRNGTRAAVIETAMGTEVTNEFVDGGIVGGYTVLAKTGDNDSYMQTDVESKIENYRVDIVAE